MTSAMQVQNGKQTFFDANGDPLASGTIEYYVPGTTTFKDTWQDPEKTILNTNPVKLDAAGRSLVWGTGWYRQVLKDSLGNVIWDQLVYAAEVETIVLEYNITGSPVGTGVSRDSYIYEDLKIIGWKLMSTVSGDIVVDIWVGTFVAGTPPTVGDTITAAAKPTLSSSVSAEDSVLTGWTVDIAANSQLRLNIDSAATVTNVTLALICEKANTP